MNPTTRLRLGRNCLAVLEPSVGSGLDNGRLVLAATSWLRETGAEDGIVMTSHDEGISWSPPREVMHGDLTYLGGQK